MVDAETASSFAAFAIVTSSIESVDSLSRNWPDLGADIVSRASLFFTHVTAEVCIDIVEAIADPHQFVRRDIDDIVNIHQVGLDCANKKWHQDLLAQLTEFVGIHMVPLCARVGAIPMPRNIAQRDVPIVSGDISEHT